MTLSRKPVNQYSSLTLFLAVFTLSSLLLGCESFVAVRGNLLNKEELTHLEVGITSFEEAQALLGPPTSQSFIHPHIYFWAGEKTSQTAFFFPTVEERKVLALEFNEEGKLAALTELDQSHGIPLEPISRRTRTPGQEPSLWQQLIGNIGKFSTPKEKKPGE